MQNNKTYLQEGLSTTVELVIQCSHLPRLDALSKSDPMVIVYLVIFINFNNVKKETFTQNWNEVGRTELIKNNHNPKFEKTITLKYFFEEKQQLRFSVLDVDNPKVVVTEWSRGKDLIGYIETTLGEIMGSKGCTVAKEIKNDEHPHRKNGNITISGLETGGNNIFVKIKARGTNLDKKDFFGKSDPYLNIYRGEDAKSTLVYKTEIIRDSLNPYWKEFSLPLGKLTITNNENTPLFIECYDWDKDSKHDLIGEFKTSYGDLKKGKKEHDLIHPDKKRKKGAKYHNSGIITLETEEYIVPTFLDYIAGGTQISLVFGIDYTASNGDPSQSNSLHFRDPSNSSHWNEYMSAIRIVGDICSSYDSTQLFPVYGFGAHLLSINAVSHNFAVNGNEQNPFCVGINGVLQAYDNSFRFCSLSGPTYFAPIINSICNLASTFAPGERYFVSLIITDGAINDMSATIDALARASVLPISFIIVGVGGADFENMKTLDDDDGKLGLKRDCVQFVPFRQYNNDLAKLAKDTLQEVPNQLLKYMNMHNIKPRPKQVYVSPESVIPSEAPPTYPVNEGL